MLLAGDIGGTKTLLALFDEQGGTLKSVREHTYPSQGYPTFDQILADFLKDQTGSPVGAACFGVAGAVIGGRSHTTNLPWTLDESTLSKESGIPRVKLLNDVESTAYGMLFLRDDELSVVQPGVKPSCQGNVAVIAAGTGLGEAMLYFDGQHHHPIASEGGHADYGPGSPLQIDLLAYLAETFHGHVSWERVLSGPAFHNIYNFLRDRGHGAESPAVAEQLRTGDANATISQLGLAGSDPLCVATLDLFCSIYGSEAGNCALRAVATGGVFLGGGIAPKILPALRKGDFLKAFAAKGRYHEFLGQIEVRVALNPRAALIGAAHYALRI